MPVKKFDRSLIPAKPDFRFETILWSQGLTAVGGIDEAGRGALAGPVAAAVIVFPPNAEFERELDGVRDSKEMTPSQRERWAVRLPEIALVHAIAFASNQEVDEIGILPATRLAIRRALTSLAITPQHLLVDYLQLPDCHTPQTSMVKGDARSLSIAAASILAKTARDEVMRQFDESLPGYGFAQHKGYGTLAHRQALATLGPSPIHRCSFHSKKIGD